MSPSSGFTVPGPVSLLLPFFPLPNQFAGPLQLAPCDPVAPPSPGFLTHTLALELAEGRDAAAGVAPTPPDIKSIEVCAVAQLTGCPNMGP